MAMHPTIEALKDGLVVSCQALPDEPLYTPEGGIMPLMALAAQQGGAVGIRANTVRDILQIKQTVTLPLIGIIKKQYPPCEPFITATMQEVDELVAAGTDIIALDCTARARIDKKNITQHIADIKEKYPTALLMGDVSNFEEGMAAAAAGVHLVSTTLNGYTSYTNMPNGEPDYRLVENLARNCGVPVVAEGNVHYPAQAAQMLAAGAHSVVVGGAITRPKEITGRFVEAMGAAAPPLVK